ncbi:hypothetical protein TSAR_003579 [Trichomalopsis sarcophagae]|uniref:Glucosidase II subunit alpha n=1 Tax=Trichomalopsis sarcophagae TaxID=543379 RepID=A0A232F1L3_9HYME|nr:hypothetical protein TSAR_003579 [Trichomalopsis sarcophagae]
MTLLWKLLILFAFATLATDAVDRNIFKTCQQSSFCRRCRQAVNAASSFAVRPWNITLGHSYVRAQLYHKKTNVNFTIELSATPDHSFRLRINERNPLKPRHQVRGVLNDEDRLALGQLKLVKHTDINFVVSSGPNRAYLQASPFKIDFYASNRRVLTVNAKGLMRFEHLRTKNSTNSGDGAELDPGAWEEEFRGHKDSKPLGPEAVALDFGFPEARYAYGLPEHADSLALKQTKAPAEPYRLYNLDVFRHEAYERMSLYGSIPLLYAHSEKSTAGVFWLNAAETWIDISALNNNNSLGDNSPPGVHAHFMSESGIIDVFCLLGPTPMDAFRQYTTLTGTGNLPPIFALGYHQSRWNYDNQSDVLQVSRGFDAHDMPLDVMWLDIEYTNGKRYFTWDPKNFSDPQTMVANLTAQGRKLVVIIDPHIKRDDQYFLHSDATKLGYYVKKRDGKDYEGESWPGPSSYLDLFNPKAREYYLSLYDFSKFKGTTKDVHIWNDMNEPSCQSGPEVTLPKDLVHYGGWEHRDVHNLYGLAQHSATYEGMLRRTEGKLRPFILTRSFFAGSQRFAAVWTGDNMAEWSHLKISYAECLSLAISGISFCGSDVTGFATEPSTELYVRWYQAGVWLPFFRQHSELTTKRREPWLLGEEVTTRVRDSLRLRYSYLPLWYTLFREHEIDGTPVIRPLWTHYPTEIDTFAIDDHLLLGDSILVRPVVEPNVSTVSVYFPGEGKVTWYDVYTQKAYSNGRVDIPVTLDRIPVYQRSGSVIPRKMKQRPSTVGMKDDPYTLDIVLDANKRARGSLYIDDQESFDYREGKFKHIEFDFKGGSLSSKFLYEGDFRTKSALEKIVIVNPPKDVSSAILFSEPNTLMNLRTEYSSDRDVLTLEGLNININKEWSIALLD